MGDQEKAALEALRGISYVPHLAREDKQSVCAESRLTPSSRRIKLGDEGREGSEQGRTLDDKAVLCATMALLLTSFALSIAAGSRAQGFPDCVNGPLASNAVCDTSLGHVERARALVEELTVAEMINNTVHTAPGVPRLGLPPYNWWNEALVR